MRTSQLVPKKLIRSFAPSSLNKILTHLHMIRSHAHMIHGPCGLDFSQAPFMEGSDCNKHYPKLFCDETRIEENGFVKYRRRDDGRRITVNGKELIIAGLFPTIVICV